MSTLAAIREKKLLGPGGSCLVVFRVGNRPKNGSTSTCSPKDTSWSKTEAEMADEPEDMMAVAAVINEAWAKFRQLDVTNNDFPAELGQLMVRLGNLLALTRDHPMDIAWVHAITSAKTILMSMAYNLGRIQEMAAEHYQGGSEQAPDVEASHRKFARMVATEQAYLEMAIGRLLDGKTLKPIA